MGEKKYVCTGTCGGSVNEEEYQQGKTTCSAENCTKHGQPLEERDYCPECEKTLDADEKHDCGC